LEALITFAFDYARIHLPLGLSKLRLDNVIESHCDGLVTDLAAPLRFSSRDTQSECSRRPLPLRRSAFCNASTPYREQHVRDEVPGQDGSAGQEPAVAVPALANMPRLSAKPPAARNFRAVLGTFFFVVLGV
jgi:hypothetical protein